MVCKNKDMVYAEGGVCVEGALGIVLTVLFIDTLSQACVCCSYTNTTSARITSPLSQLRSPFTSALAMVTRASVLSLDSSRSLVAVTEEEGGVTERLGAPCGVCVWWRMCEEVPMVDWGWLGCDGMLWLGCDGVL